MAGATVTGPLTVAAEAAPRPAVDPDRSADPAVGIAADVAARLKIYPNGATAIRHLAESNALRPIGCTQSTEIISTPGVVLSGSLPPGYELATMYTAAVTTRAANARQAKSLIEMLTDAEGRDLRIRAGLLDAQN